MPCRCIEKSLHDSALVSCHFTNFSCLNLLMIIMTWAFGYMDRRFHNLASSLLIPCPCDTYSGKQSSDWSDQWDTGGHRCCQRQSLAGDIPGRLCSVYPQTSDTSNSPPRILQTNQPPQLTNQPPQLTGSWLNTSLISCMIKDNFTVHYPSNAAVMGLFLGKFIRIQYLNIYHYLGFLCEIDKFWTVRTDSVSVSNDKTCRLHTFNSLSTLAF